MWPVWALTAVVSVAAKFAFWDWTHATQANWWTAQLLTLALGLGLSWARWSNWRRRHPVLTPEQMVEVLRRSAPYN